MRPLVYTKQSCYWFIATITLLIARISHNKVAGPGLNLQLALVITLYLRSKGKYSRDTDDFKEALYRWRHWLIQAGETPRAVKRFSNSLRFTAILMCDGLSNSDLVALAAIHHVDANWLIDDEQFEQLIEGNVESLLSEKLTNENQSKQQVQSIIDKVAPVLKQALEAEPNSWQADEVRQLGRAVIEQYMVDKI